MTSAVHACPHCKQDAPMVNRGVTAVCTACGAPRVPLTNTSVNLAGGASRVGGAMMQGIGWVVLVLGLLLAAMLVAVVHAFVAGAAAFWVGVPLGVLALVVGALLVRGGGSLQQHGAGANRAARERAVRALAEHRGGVVTAPMAAQSLGVQVAEADALLTEMAEQPAADVWVDVDDNGIVLYRFRSATPVRFADNATPASRVRVDERERVRVVSPTPPPVVDAEFVEDEAPAGRGYGGRVR